MLFRSTRTSKHENEIKRTKCDSYVTEEAKNDSGFSEFCHEILDCNQTFNIPEISKETNTTIDKSLKLYLPSAEIDPIYSPKNCNEFANNVSPINLFSPRNGSQCATPHLDYYSGVIESRHGLMLSPSHYQTNNCYIPTSIINPMTPREYNDFSAALNEQNMDGLLNPFESSPMQRINYDTQMDQIMTMQFLGYGGSF